MEGRDRPKPKDQASKWSPERVQETRRTSHKAVDHTGTHKQLKNGADFKAKGASAGDQKQPAKAGGGDSTATAKAVSDGKTRKPASDLAARRARQDAEDSRRITEIKEKIAAMPDQPHDARRDKALREKLK